MLDRLWRLNDFARLDSDVKVGRKRESLEPFLRRNIRLMRSGRRPSAKGGRNNNTNTTLVRKKPADRMRVPSSVSGKTQIRALSSTSKTRSAQQNAKRKRTHRSKPMTKPQKQRQPPPVVTAIKSNMHHTTLPCGDMMDTTEHDSSGDDIVSMCVRMC